MTWSLSAMFWCTSTWAPSLGRASRLLPKGRSMNGSVRRKCPHLSRFFVKDIHVSVLCVYWGPEECIFMKLQLILISVKCHRCETFVIPGFASWFSDFVCSYGLVWVSSHCFSLHFSFYSRVLHISEFLPFVTFRWQARLLLSTPALQEPFPSSGILLWLCLWLEHVKICKCIVVEMFYALNWNLLNLPLISCRWKCNTDTEIHVW